MDPLSLSVSIITLLGAGGSIAKALGKLHLASDALFALNNEVSDLHVIVLETNRILQEHGNQIDGTQSTPNSISKHLGSLLERAKQKLLELETLIEYRLTTPGASNDARPRKVAWIREQKRIKIMQEEIRSIRTSIVAVIGLLTSRSAFKVELEIAELRPIYQEIRALAATQLTRASQSAASRDEWERTLPKIFQAQDRTERKLDELLSTFLANSGRIPEAEFQISTATRSQPGSSSSFVHPYSIQLISTYTREQSEYTRSCTCHCHRRSTWKSPGCLRSLLGLLFLGYAGLPNIGHHCNDVRCQCLPGATVRIRYCFPAWFLNHIVEFYLRISKPAGLTQNLRVSRVVSNTASILQSAYFGDVDSITSLIFRGEGSPFDVSCDDGWTPLMYAIRGVNLDACQLLIDAGADPLAENFKQESCRDVAWSLILGNCWGRETEAVKLIFKEPELEKYDFNPIHRAVLELGSLESALQECSAEVVDQGDSLENRTPLSWSACRGDLLSMKFLLQRGASVHRRDRRLRTPLAYALVSGNYDCAKLLLENGADANAADRVNWSPIHRLISIYDDISLVYLLLEYNASIEVRDIYGCTPLIVAIDHKRFSVTETLIELGADIHAQDNLGCNGFSVAVYRNAHSILRILLKRGADHTGTISEIGSFLHSTATYADIKTLQLLSRGNLATRNIHSKDPRGRTAIEVARARTDVDSDWLIAFQEFIASVDPTKARVSPYERAPIIHDVTDESDSMDEEFVEAPEN